MKAQMKIQQMAFMLMAVFFFFVLVGLFFLGISFRGVEDSAQQLQREQALSSLEVIADMPELNFNSVTSMALDEDKLRVMSGNLSEDYANFWPVASIKAYKIYPKPESFVKCPAVDCNYFEVYDSGQTNVQEYSAYVSICKKVRESGYTYDKCEAGKLVLGVIDVDG
ncbi:MAG: hypothetical protein KKF50_03670 [Nanoarchaeota archaeon]|nr:hypothetical protein [Nanoarchaeota archaeon]